MKNENPDYYIALEDPKDFRRELLGSTKVIIKLLQRYEMIKGIREKKVEVMYKYSKVNAEINMLANKLKRTIPKLKNQSLPKINIPDNTSTQRPSNKNLYSINTIQETGHLDDLHNQLADIEKKINNLN